MIPVRNYEFATHTVPLEFSQIVAKLVEAVSLGGEVEGAEDGLVDFAGRPTADMSAGVQQDLEEADDAGVVDFDAGGRTEPTTMGSAVRCSSGKLPTPERRCRLCGSRSRHD